MAAKKFDFSKFFSFEKLNENIYESIEVLELFELQLKELAKTSKVKLSGSVKDMKAMNNEVENLLKLTKATIELEKLKIQNEKLQQKLTQQKTKASKTQNTVEKEKIKQQQILNNLADDTLTNEEKIIAQIELSKSKQRELQATVGKTSKAYQEEARKIEELNESLKRERKERQLNTKINKAAEGSLEQLRAKKLLLELQTSQLSEAQREETEEGKALVEQLAQVNQQLIDFGKSTNDGRANVGRYKEDIIAASGALGGLSDELSSVSEALNVFSGIFGKIKGGFAEANEEQSTFARRSKKVKSGLKGIFAGGVVGLIGSIALYFTKSATGAEQLEVQLARLKASLNVVIGYIAQLGGVVVNKLQIGWLKAQLAFEKFTNAVNVFSDDDEAEKKIKSINAEIKQLQDENENVDTSFDTLTEKIKNAGDEGARLAILQINLRKARREIELSIAELEKQLELFIAIGEDDTKNFARRKKAQEEAIKLNKRLADERLSIARQELQIAEIQLKMAKDAGTVSEEEAEAVKEAKIGLIETEKEYMLTIRDNAELRNKLISDEYELLIDVNRDAFDSRKTINEQTIASDKETFEARQQLLNDTVKLGEQSFNRQIELINDFRKISLQNDNETLNSQLELLSAKKELSDIEKNYRDELNSQIAANNEALNEELDIQKFLNAESESELELLIKNSALGEKFGIQLLTSIRDRWTAVNDLKTAQSDLDNKVIESAENQFKLNNLFLDLLAEEKDSKGQALISDKELYEQRIEFEKELLEAQLKRLVAVNADDLTQQQTDEIVELKKKLLELGNAGKESGEKIKEGFDPLKSLFSLFSKNFKGTKEELKALEDSFVSSFQTIFSSATEIFQNLNNLQKDKLQKDLEIIQEGINATQEKVDEEKALAEAGKANNLRVVEEELQALQEQEEKKKKTLEDAEKRERKFAAVQTAIKTALTITNLILAASEAIAANASIPIVGVAVGIAAAAALVAGFIAIKSQLNGLHDGTESVEGPSGHDNAGIFKLEKGERVISAKDNSDIPRREGKLIKNKEIPDLIRAGLMLEIMQTPDQLLTVVQERQPDNSEMVEIMKKMYKQNQNREEIANIKGRSAKISYKDGKINKITYIQ